jgi:hypothetical protein
VSSLHDSTRPLARKTTPRRRMTLLLGRLAEAREAYRQADDPG